MRHLLSVKMPNFS